MRVMQTPNQAPRATTRRSSESSLLQVGMMNNVLTRAATATATPALRVGMTAGARSLGHEAAKGGNKGPGQGGNKSSRVLGLVGGAWLAVLFAGQFYTGGKFPEMLFNNMSQLFDQGSSTTQESTPGTSQVEEKFPQRNFSGSPRD